MPDQPPIAPRHRCVRRRHGDRVVDDYAWMRDKDAPELLAYLTAENEWTARATAHLEPLREAIFADIKARTRQTDLSVPEFVRHEGGAAYWYYSRTVEGFDYPIHCRLAASSPDGIPDVTEAPAGEQVLLDENVLARGHDYLGLGLCDVSPDGSRLAYSVDLAGDERYDLHVVDLSTATELPDRLTGIGGGGCWAGPDHLVYLEVDQAWRPHRVKAHRLGDPAERDAIVLAEPDERFWLDVDESRDRRWVIVSSDSKLSSEYRLLSVDDPGATPRVVTPRREGVEYSVEVGADELYLVHNDGATDFALARAGLDCAGVADWEPVLPGRPGIRLLGVSALRRWVILTSRREGLPLIEVMTRAADGQLGPLVEVGFEESLFSAHVDAGEDPDGDRLRLLHESMVTPPRIEEYRLDTGQRRALKQTPVLDHPERGPFRPSDYVQRRDWATAPDGARIPLSIVHRADTPLDGSAPALLYGYGAYEASLTPWFSIPRLSLLDRGFVFAVAHVRGGGERGRAWYEQGRLLAKKNTFDDFVACARHLVSAGYTATERLAAEGGSAGGLLIGAAINQAPEAFRAVHAAVPFVDALNTILNPDLPLTVTEWEEWGDPLHDPAVYAYMKSYTPYENIRAGRYPAILVTTSLHDTRVEVTEPAKWVAALRRTLGHDPDRPILLKTELISGHGGASARYQAWHDAAFEYAWLIDQVSGRTDERPRSSPGQTVVLD